MLVTPATARKRKQDRNKKSSATISVSWTVYDKLDNLATAENASLGQIVEGLINVYEGSTDSQPDPAPETTTTKRRPVA